MEARRRSVGVSRGRLASSSVPTRARSQKLRTRDRIVGRRGRRFPAAPGTTSTPARSRTELDTVETRETRHVLSRASDRGTSSERLREAAMRRCGYRPRACVPARVRSSLASREKRFRASEALPAYLVVRRHVADDSYPRSDRRISLGSADRRREGSCSRRNAARFSTGARVRDAAARESGGDERVSRVRRVPVRVVLVAPSAPRSEKTPRTRVLRRREPLTEFRPPKHGSSRDAARWKYFVTPEPMPKRSVHVDYVFVKPRRSVGAD